MQGIKALITFVWLPIRKSIWDSARTAEHHSFVIGLLGFVGFISYYPIWKVILPQSYENATLRFVGAVLSLLITLKPYWFRPLRAYFPWFWYFTVLYALPFFFTFMLAKNQFSPHWLTSMVIAIYLLILLVDIIGFVVLSLLGFGLAMLFFYLSGQSLVIPEASIPALFVFPFAIISGMVVRYRAEEEAKEKLTGALSAASSIAHELRTPLLGIQAGVVGLRKYFPVLLEGWSLARERGLPVAKIRTVKYRTLCTVLGRMEDEIHYSNAIITMLLTNARKQIIEPSTFTLCPITSCIENALARYPFANQQERSAIHWHAPDEKFYFLGSATLMEHVLFNLLNNALYFIHKDGKGEISLWLNALPNEWQLHFKDTGAGIPAHQLPYIFDPFYSTKETGTGLGLSFCKRIVTSFGGKISCHSVLGEYAEFVISFPIEGEQQ
ncbi:MAG: HAMP domain-containing histidine kinase [Gammaproteobacteria bacterium]|nr:HAMP domain-containing histidine kinase [Gammaproteobacteria bacterium]